MRHEEFDIYPILHEGKVYNVISPFDMTFKEVHAMLAWLDEKGAFSLTAEEERMGPKMFTCEVLGASFEVDVQGYEVVVYRRNRQAASAQASFSGPPGKRRGMGKRAGPR